MWLLFQVCEVEQEHTRTVVELSKVTELTADVQLCLMILEKNFIVSELLFGLREEKQWGEQLDLDRLVGPPRFHVVE